MKVKLSEVLNALDMTSDELRFFYSVKDEQVRMLPDEFLDQEEVDRALRRDIKKHPDDYIALPDRFAVNEYSIMRDFIAALPEDATQDRLFDAIRGKGAFRRFKNAISAAGLEDQWYAWRNQAFVEIARDWCLGEQIEIIDDGDEGRSTENGKRG